jgi:hypothetical protein
VSRELWQKKVSEKQKKSFFHRVGKVQGEKWVGGKYLNIVLLYSCFFYSVCMFKRLSCLFPFLLFLSMYVCLSTWLAFEVWDHLSSFLLFRSLLPLMLVFVSKFLLCHPRYCYQYSHLIGMFCFYFVSWFLFFLLLSYFSNSQIRHAHCRLVQFNENLELNKVNLIK